jgi:hypothetical protein
MEETMSGKYAQKTSVNKDASLAEIERTLTRYGATGFLYGWSGTDAMVGFVLRNRQFRLIIPMPDRNSREFLRTPKQGRLRSKTAAQEAYDQAVRQRWRALALYVKAALEAVEAGILSFEDAFLAYTALPGGPTVGQWMQPQLERTLEQGQMPPLLPLPQE